MTGAEFKIIKVSHLYKQVLALLLFTLILIPSCLLAEQHVQGAVEGRWTPEKSPYIVDNTIWVESNASLIIEGGVEVLFTAEDSLIVYGTLLTDASPTARVCFRIVDGSSKKWCGIYFYGFSSSPSILQYSVLLDVTHGVNCTNSSPTINYNYINSIYWGFNAYLSNPTFVGDTIVIENDLMDPIVVVGIQLSGSLINIANSVVDIYSSHIDNSISAFGIHSEYTDLILWKNRIKVGAKGRPVGIYTYESDKDSILYNEVVVYSDLVYVDAGLVQNSCTGGTIINNTFDIWSPNKDTGLKFQNYSNGATIKNNIVQGDSTCEGIVFRESIPLYLSYNDFYRHSTIFVGIPEIDTTNIFENPQFYEVLPDSFYYLTMHSPCIDAGDPSILDPNGSISDMGAYYYHYTVEVESDPAPVENYELFTCYPNPTNNSAAIAFVLNDRELVKVTLHDITGRLVADIQDGLLEPGSYHFDCDFSSQSSGVYFVTVKSGKYIQTKKLVLLK